MLRSWIVLWCILVAIAATPGQTSSGLIAYYSFDNCDATDDSGNGADGVIDGNPECVCGVRGFALQFDGLNDFVRILGSFDILFAEDFTISFYMLPEQFSGIIDIFSKKDGCTIDASVSIRYEGTTRMLRAEISENINRRTEIRYPLSVDRCWHHITWVRSGTLLRLYLNGVLVETGSTPPGLNVSNNGVFSIANSPCLPSGELRFRGRLDELRLYNRALSTAEVEGLFFDIDRIASRDTFLFVGDDMRISLSRTCASTFLWSPQADVMFPTDAEPLVMPQQSTTYQVQMEYRACIATDSVRITVIDPSQVGCEDVFMPNAFTPNSDLLNDAFGVSNKFFLGDFIALEIYDRWGARVFRGDTPADRWDGTINRQPAMPGIYVYRLSFRCDQREIFRTGSFSLLR